MKQVDSPWVMWQDYALCLGYPQDVFFPKRGEDTRPAKRICAMCTVREQCLDFAIEINEPFGIWGGLSQRERARAKRDRARAAKPVTLRAV